MKLVQFMRHYTARFGSRAGDIVLLYLWEPGQLSQHLFHFGKRDGLAYVYSPVSVGKPSCDTPFRRSGPWDEEDHSPA